MWQKNGNFIRNVWAINYSILNFKLIISVAGKNIVSFENKYIKGHFTISILSTLHDIKKPSFTF